MFQNGGVWRDTDGNPIQAHGGGILFHEGIYYWYGENKDVDTRDNFRVDVVGVSCYASWDLLKWENMGVVLPAVPHFPQHDLHPSKVVERPKVLFNAATGKFVMWMHVDHADYSYARTGVAISDTPDGTFTYLGSISPCGADSRDMTLFQDDDGSAYLFFSSEYNRNITVARLSDDYLQIGDEFTKTLIHARRNDGRESPAVFKHLQRYYMITSGCTGWESNAAELAVADHPLGPWQAVGNPCVGADADKTFYAQSTFVLQRPHVENEYIFMADRWNNQNLRDSRYVWLPFSVGEEGVEIEWREYFA
jgi:beta-galactosidase